MSKFQVAVSSHGRPSVDSPTATTEEVCTSRGTPAAATASITLAVPTTLAADISGVTARLTLTWAAQ